MSLNMEGSKPFVPNEGLRRDERSAARFHGQHVLRHGGGARLPVKFRKHGGAFWGQSLTNVFERILDEDTADLILTVDYDSIFTRSSWRR
jgi:hypothetical protein